jgi:antitoxin component of RelBE/YafQ-DinJ toxin-antitoxin module
MNPKNELSRITIDISSEAHKRLKSMAAVQGKSMRKIVVELIDNQLSKAPKKDDCPYSHIPNKKTVKAIKDAQKGKGLVKAKNAKDLFKKLGI